MSILDFNETPSRGKATSRKSLKMVLGIGVISGAFALSSTLASNIALNDGGNVEFGQGVAQTTACSDGQSLIVTPLSSFTNSDGEGSFDFTGVSVSDIPESCDGVDFKISAYNTSGDALAIFNEDSTVATIWNDEGTFKRGIGSAGMTVASTTGSFTVEFTTPVAVSTDVARVTIQSTAHASLASLSCADGGPCNLGDTGPGGGKVFFVSDGFDCGPDQSLRCDYLEVSPSDVERYTTFTAGAYADYPSTHQSSTDFGLSQIGAGFKYSRTYPLGGGATNIANTYTGGGYRDWYIGSISEMNVLCKWAKGQNPTVGTRCESSGSVNSPTYGAQNQGFGGDYRDNNTTNYWTSIGLPAVNQFEPTGVWKMQFQSGEFEASTANGAASRVRPIRAF